MKVQCTFVSMVTFYAVFCTAKSGFCVMACGLAKANGVAK